MNNKFRVGMRRKEWLHAWSNVFALRVGYFAWNVVKILKLSSRKINLTYNNVTLFIQGQVRTSDYPLEELLDYLTKTIKIVKHGSLIGFESNLFIFYMYTFSIIIVFPFIY